MTGWRRAERGVSCRSRKMSGDAGGGARPGGKARGGNGVRMAAVRQAGWRASVVEMMKALAGCFGKYSRGTFRRSSQSARITFATPSMAWPHRTNRPI
jgi:hypothetical protein